MKKRNAKTKEKRINLLMIYAESPDLPETEGKLIFEQRETVPLFC
jgi:hypothetical protein